MATLPLRAVPDLPASHPCFGCQARKVAICGMLSPDELARFREEGCSQTVSADQPLFHQGDRAAHVYNVAQGGLRLYRLLPDGRRQIMSFMLPGDFIGLPPGEEHAFTAEAMSGSQLCRFAQSRFDEFAGNRPAFQRELTRRANQELAAAHEQMVLLGRKSALERLASFILDLLERQEAYEECRQRIVELPMNRLEIADYLGLTKETVSRVFAELKSLRLIRLAALTRVELLDREGLRRLAEGYGSA